LCCVLWMYRCPHKKKLDKHDRADQNMLALKLHRTLGSFFLNQWFVNVAITYLQAASNCASSYNLVIVLDTLMVFFTLAVSVQVTNMLCHRYLLERAKAMASITGGNKAIGGRQDDNQRREDSRILRLQKSFKFEMYTFIISAGAIVCYPFKETENIAFMSGFVLFFFVGVADFTFSYLVTSYFLEPILETLKMAQGVVKSKGADRMRRTRNSVFIGTVVCVGSSTVTIVILLAFFITMFIGEFYIESTIWLQPFVFVVNADSMVNDLGMLLICGIFTQYCDNENDKYSANNVGQNGASGANSKTSKVAPGSSFTFDSRAYEDESANDSSTEN